MEKKNGCLKIGKTYGIVSIIVIGSAIVLAMIVGWVVSTIQGIIYTALVLVGLTIIVTQFCVKCSIKENCMHGIIGPLTKVFPDKREEPYSKWNQILTFLSIIIILFYPIIFLINYQLILVLFWILIITGIIMIVTKVCKSCGNKKCPMCKN